MSGRHLKSERGLSLIELIVAATVLAVGAAAVMTVFNSINQLNRRARNFTTANQLAQKRVEIYRNSIFSNIVIGTEDFSNELPANFGSPKSATAVISDADPNADAPDPIELKRVDITISYTDGGRTKNVSVSTLIAKRGINR